MRLCGRSCRVAAVFVPGLTAPAPGAHPALAPHRTQAPGAAPAPAPASEAAGAAAAVCGMRVELSDGWYAVPAGLDAALAQLVMAGRIRVREGEPEGCGRVRV